MSDSSHPNELQDRIGYESIDIFDLIGQAAAFAIEGDIAAECGGDFETYRQRCVEAQDDEEDE